MNTLKDYRLAANLTQQELCQRCPLAVSHYGRIERGYVYPRPETVRRLARCLRISAGSLRKSIDAQFHYHPQDISS